MNKTLLLILCDFLLLNLLALTRWEKAEPPRPKRPPVPELAANAVTKEQDLVETMRQSLSDEKAVRDELAQKLSATDLALAAREQSLAQAQAERNKLAEERRTVTAALTETQRAAAELAQKVSAATQEATMTKGQLVQLQRELAEKQAEADRQRQAVASLEKQQADSRRQLETLTMAVVVGEQEKKSLRETAEALKGQVEVERSERRKVQEATTQLAQGVGQLAERSSELSKEIRDNRPINANVLFGDFLANRVTANFTASRKGFLGPATRAKEASTVLVTDGRQVYALLHIADTVFSLGDNPVDWESLAVELARGAGIRSAAPSVQFLAHDPRIVVLPLEAAQAASLGARIYPLPVDPFKFPEAVLIDAGGRGYGEVGFKLDPTEPGFVRVDNRFFKRLFGDFAPSRGDLVFSKTGELLGIMVNSDYCALLKSFAPLKTIRPGADILGQSTGALLDSLTARVRAMPLKLQ
ncbi:MAG: hypothetical protein HY736_12405 [Verrucomicrobia bacterium]|nr:hypothetical protein [Verrucomicrobiota bacterium]